MGKKIDYRTKKGFFFPKFHYKEHVCSKDHTVAPGFICLSQAIMVIASGPHLKCIQYILQLCINHFHRLSVSGVTVPLGSFAI